jgi:hypothetical protein
MTRFGINGVELLRSAATALVCLLQTQGYAANRLHLSEQTVNDERAIQTGRSYNLYSCYETCSNLLSYLTTMIEQKRSDANVIENMGRKSRMIR